MEIRRDLRLKDEVSKQELNQVPQLPKIEPTVRKAFADTAYWNARLMTDVNGIRGSILYNAGKSFYLEDKVMGNGTWNSSR